MFIINLILFLLIIIKLTNVETKQENNFSLKELILQIENKQRFINLNKEKLTKEEIEKINLEIENKKYEILTKENEEELIKVLCNNKIIKFIGEAFRFIFRKYFCDEKYFKNKNKWIKYGNNFIENYFDDIIETSIDIHKIFLKRNDKYFPHNYKEDFVFMVLYPIEFKQLRKLFKINLNELLINLTFLKLNNLKELNKRESKYLNSWNEKLFIKSLLTKPKWFTKLEEENKGIPKFLLKLIKEIIDPIIEKNFFFSEYVEFNKDVYDSLGGNTLLPKYLFLFKFLPIPNIENQNPLPNNENQPIFFTIQNGLFPKGIPKINLKFDLKGASRELIIKDELKENYENKEQILMEIEFFEIFPNGIIFEDNEKYKQFIKIIEEDSKFLSERNIIDYSLLLGIHFIEENKNKKFNFNSSLNWMNGINAKAITCTNLFNKNLNSNEIKNKKNCKMFKLLLFGGIIDILQTYTIKRNLKQKLLELQIKNKNVEKHKILPEELPISIIEPKLYQKQINSNLKNKYYKIIMTIEVEINIVKIWEEQNNILLEILKKKNNKNLKINLFDISNAIRNSFINIKEIKQLNKQQINLNEIIFKRNNINHNFINDFKFTILYPKEFKELCNNYFNINLNKILLLITLFPLNNFDSKTKGNCNFLTSWNKQFLLKTLQTEPKWFDNWSKNSNLPNWLLNLLKNIIEPYSEKHFFFEENKQKELIYSFNYSTKNDFKGSFIEYFNKIKKIKNKTLLPKYFLSFIIEELPINNSIKIPPTIFTIQNGLFPEGIPKLHLKFDLKGSFREVKLKGGIINIEEGIEDILKEINIKNIFPNGIIFENQNKYKEFVKMIEEDSKFLSEKNIIDYSLLLGIHLINENEENKRSYNLNKEGIYAKALIEGKERRIILFYGIIDIFQNYSIRKNLKQKWLQLKALYNGEWNELFPKEDNILTMSVIEPSKYRERFINFITKIVLLRLIKENTFMYINNESIIKLLHQIIPVIFLYLFSLDFKILNYYFNVNFI
ncbi:hypothetical protein Mgra_00004238 [Meloidogyne graminicola]|uniref:PIPK domain-containing protein n=1 Tax=Meloidogyne graminicola TaxID=189291 RepID=A0A8S9ZTB5_9BILA|nr:hypothetical protein Mgra_00004238 [Meloidogyne graminicola]